VEIAIAMLAQESSPHNTFETSTSFATFSVFALPGCTVQSLPFLLTALLAVAEESGGADRAENVREVWCGGFDLARDVLGAVVKDIVCFVVLN
jgi:hypothetical protein